MAKITQITGGTTLSVSESDAGVRRDVAPGFSMAEIFAALTTTLLHVIFLGNGKDSCEHGLKRINTANCATSATSSVEANIRRKQVESPLTLELREFIDSVIVPILVRQFISERAEAEKLARERGDVAKSHGNTASLEY